MKQWYLDRQTGVGVGRLATEGARIACIQQCREGTKCRNIQQLSQAVGLHCKPNASLISWYDLNEWSMRWFAFTSKYPTRSIPPKSLFVVFFIVPHIMYEFMITRKGRGNQREARRVEWSGVWRGTLSSPHPDLQNHPPTQWRSSHKILGGAPTHVIVVIFLLMSHKWDFKCLINGHLQSISVTLCIEVYFHKPKEFLHKMKNKTGYKKHKYSFFGVLLLLK